MDRHIDLLGFLCLGGGGAHRVFFFKELPGCLFTRTFLPKSSYTLLHMLECLKLHAPPLTSLICEIFMEISSYPCNCIYIYN